MANSENYSRIGPPGAPAWVTAALIEHTIRVWQPYYANPLTIEDAIDMMQAVGQLVGILSHKKLDP
jgi:hypothetical protein